MRSFRATPVVFVALLFAGCGPSVLRLHSGSATRSEVAIVELKTQIARVVAFDNQALPRPARDTDDIAVELLPGGHCVQLVRPRLFSALDPPLAAGEVRPSELSEAYWFEVVQGAKYVVGDYVLPTSMFDQYMVHISEIRPDGSLQPAGGSTTQPSNGVTCRPFPSQ